MYGRQQSSTVCQVRSVSRGHRSTGPSGPLGFNFAQHSPTTRPSVGRTAKKDFLLSDRVEFSSAEAREEGIKGGSLGVFCNGAYGNSQMI